ncbi:MAG TPA: hypothetical protein VJT08_18680 [Terriglobales bacterium]|nr:hypothetical protein [Terriglobales bacterium]
MPNPCLILASMGEHDGEDSQFGLFGFDDAIQRSWNPMLAQTAVDDERPASAA